VVTTSTDEGGRVVLVVLEKRTQRMKVNDHPPLYEKIYQITNLTTKKPKEETQT
jgi:hypothetical protein